MLGLFVDPEAEVSDAQYTKQFLAALVLNDLIEEQRLTRKLTENIIKMWSGK